MLRTHPNIEERLQQLQRVELKSHWQPLVLSGRFDPHWERAQRTKRRFGGWWP